MQLNIQPFSKRSKFQALVLNRKVTGSLMLLSALGLGAVFSAPKVHAGEIAMNKSNLYEERYYEQNDHQLKSLKVAPDTTLKIGENQEADTTRMLEDGYDMMGTSEFISVKLPAELARTFGQKIKADVVLVHNKPLAFSTNIVNLDGTEDGNKMAKDANDANSKDLRVIHYASYWAKIPMPLLGVQVIKLVKTAANQAEEGVVQPGLKIIAVIKESPAAKARIVTGDTLLKIGDVELTKADDLFAAVNRYQGQSVEILLRRAEEDIKTTVALNSRR